MKQWYVSRKNKKFGPFSQEEIIGLRQRNSLQESDLVWTKGQKQWKPLITVEEFSPHTILQIIHHNKNSDVINRRKVPRVRVETALLVHDQTQLWRAQSRTLSEGGALIEIDNPHLAVGHALHIHFQSLGPGIPPFSCEAVIRARRFTPDRIKFNTTFQYSVEFKKMDKGAIDYLKKHIELILKNEPANHLME